MIFGYHTRHNARILRDFRRKSAYVLVVFLVFAGALTIYAVNEPGRDLHELGDSLIEAGQFALAKTHYLKAIQTSQKPDSTLAHSYHKLGYYYYQVKSLDQSIRYTDSALVLRKALLGENSLQTADSYNQLGLCYLEDGQFGKSLDYLQQAYAIRAKSEYARMQQAESLNNLGYANMANNDTSECLAYFNAAIDLYSEDAELNAERIGDVLSNIAFYYSSQGRWQSASQYYNQALGYYKGLVNNHPAVSAVFQNLGNLYNSSGIENPVPYYNKALEGRLSYYGPIHPEVAQTLFSIGLYYFFENNYEQTETFLDSCVSALGFNYTSDMSLFAVNNYPLFFNTLRLLALSADSYETALDYYSRLDVLIDFLRVRWGSTDDQFDLSEQAHMVYGEAIDHAYAKYLESDEFRYVHLAFKYAEKSKAVVLLDGLKRNNAAKYGGVPLPFLDSITLIESKIAEIRQQDYFQQTDALQTDLLPTKIFRLQEKLNALEKKVEIEYPAYFQLRYRADVPTVYEIQQSIAADASMVSYFVANNDIYAFVINQDYFNIYKIPKTPYYESAFDPYVNSIRQFPYAPTSQLDTLIPLYNETAYFFYYTLLRPFESYLNQDLILLPDKELHFLPFSAFLVNEIKDNQAFSDYPYLINEFSLQYVPNVQIYLDGLTTEIKDQPAMYYAGFAPSFYNISVAGLGELRYNVDEVTSAKETVGGKIFVNERATKEQFLREIQKADIIHLATHGLANLQNDAFSFLLFSAVDSLNAKQDAFLYVNEIYQQHVPAELLILSACETAKGSFKLSEGIMSIARSFLYAGAKSIIATRWSVNDRTTEMLISNFMYELKQGNAKNRALQSSIIHLINHPNPQYAHPFYWSSFMMFGRESSLQFQEKSNITRVIWIGLGIILSLLIYWIIKNRVYEKQA